eukprot:1226564-Rhodomonas_salina.3
MMKLPSDLSRTKSLLASYGPGSIASTGNLGNFVARFGDHPTKHRALCTYGNTVFWPTMHTQCDRPGLKTEACLQVSHDVTHSSTCFEPPPAPAKRPSPYGSVSRRRRFSASGTERSGFTLGSMCGVGRPGPESLAESDSSSDSVTVT